ncbi:hypothetical protein HD554DRAFT_729805 [Boletus coccyginus]|nr:hypothetical protein HD554DRAFT_729805 [Boletus coccyginus]
MLTCIEQESVDEHPFAGATILESDFETSPFYSPTFCPEHVTHGYQVSQQQPFLWHHAINLAFPGTSFSTTTTYLTTYRAASRTAYNRVPAIWSTDQRGICYSLPVTVTLAPNSLPSYVTELSIHLNSTNVQTILNQTTLYPYDAVSSEDRISGAVLSSPLFNRWQITTSIVPRSTSPRSRRTRPTQSGNAYMILFTVNSENLMTANL